MEHTVFSYLFPWRHAGLIRQFATREIAMRYRQSWLGMFWAVLTPLLMLGVYTLVFRHVFKVRWPGAEETNLAFALRLYAALAVFNFFFIEPHFSLMAARTQDIVVLLTFLAGRGRT